MSSPLHPSGRLRPRAVALLAAAVAAVSGVWLASYVAPEVEVARVVVDAGEAPRDADPGEFCRASGLLHGLDPEASLASRVNQLRGSAAELAEVGTPDDVPPAARRGFVAYVESSGVVTADEVRSLTDGSRSLAGAFALQAAEADDLAVFGKYVAATCFTTAPTSSTA